MENNFRHQEFEEFLQNQIKNHRMYPNDASWQNIKKKLHGDKKWPALTIAAVAIFSISLFIGIYFSPKPNIFASNNLNQTALYKEYQQQKNVLPINKVSRGISFIKQTKPLNSNKNYTHNSESRNLKIPTTVIAEKNQLKKDEIENKIYDNSKPILLQSQSKIYDYSGNNEENTKLIESSLALKSSMVTPAKPRQNIAPTFIEPTNKNEKNKQPKLTLIQEFNARHYKKGFNNKLALQFYIAPSMSYRILSEKKHDNKNIDGPVALNYVADVNNVVRHKPGTGLEAGLSFVYSMTKTFRLKSGLQFNMRQYSIEAYRSNTELASIALVSGNQLDTVNSIAIYRISNGFYSTDLVNKYFQLSIPVGVEWQIIGNKKLQWNIAGTIQPTYLLNRDAYLISTNFKNYTESPNVIRRWNFNSNIETFISFKSGGFKWQVGPQVRYQPNSTFISQYPIKEYLLDYGLKVGISTGF